MKRRRQQPGSFVTSTTYPDSGLPAICPPRESQRADNNSVIDRTGAGDATFTTRPVGATEAAAAVGRIGWFAILMAVAAAVIAIRYAALMLAPDAASTGVEVRLPTVERGPILDRNGRVLALTTSLDSVTAWLPAVTDVAVTAERLADILTLDPTLVTTRLNRGTDFVFIQRQVTPTQSEAIEAARQAGALPGISLLSEHGRSYPEQELAAHVLGFVGIDNVGLEGIENTFNHVLAPPTIEPHVDEVFGNQVVLTLDINVQHELERIAIRAQREHDTDSVFILAVEARTGEILAYVARPTYDPNVYGNFSARRRENAIAARAYEPGSVFKVFSVAAMLDAGAIDTTTILPSPGFYERLLSDGSSIRIDDLGVYGAVDAQQILQFSSNAGAAYASDLIDAEEMYRQLRQLGFGSPTGVPFPGESAGILRVPELWSRRSKPTIAIGQEVSVTALQMVAAASAVANDGLLLRPHLVSRVVSPQGELLKDFATEPVSEALAPSVARSVLQMMEAATGDGGTARRARVPGYRISAKTGTAQVADPSTGGYYEDRVTASVLGIFPTEDPQFIVYIVLHNPKGERRFGGVIAAPLLGEAAAFLLGHYRVPPSSADRWRQSASLNVPLPPPLEFDGAMPDLRGVAARRLHPLLAARGLRLILHGAGFVYAQSPSPGVPLAQGDTVELWLE